MSSRWSEGFRTALTLRLGLWYAGLFAISAAVLLTFTYLLLGRALAAQDREVLESMLERYSFAYQRSGLPGLQSLVDADESEGRHERLLVRVTNDKAEIVYFAQPPGGAASTSPRSTNAPRANPGSRSTTRSTAAARSRHRSAAARPDRPDRTQLAGPRRGAHPLPRPRRRGRRHRRRHRHRRRRLRRLRGAVAGARLQATTHAILETGRFDARSRPAARAIPRSARRQHQHDAGRLERLVAACAKRSTTSRTICARR
jgi:hypothetical protein